MAAMLAIALVKRLQSRSFAAVMLTLVRRLASLPATPRSSSQLALNLIVMPMMMLPVPSLA